MLKRTRRSGRPLSRYLCPSFVMIWISLAKPLELVYDILMCGDCPNVSVMTREEKGSIRLRFRDGSVRA